MGVVENMKDVADLVRKFNDIELNRRILKLEEEVLDLSRDKRRAEEKIEELERALKFKGELTFKDPYYWLEGDKSPYCAGCWDSKHLAVRVVTVTHPMLHNQKQCPSCKHVYEGGRL
jgi:rubrerythrin